MRASLGLLHTDVQAFADVSTPVQKRLVEAWKSESKLREEIHVMEAKIRYVAEVGVLEACTMLHLSEEAKKDLAQQRELHREAAKARRVMEKEKNAAIAEDQEAARTAQEAVVVRRSEQHARAAYTSHGSFMMMDWR